MSAPNPYIGNPHSVDLMRRIDERLSPEYRALVYEYGFEIIAKSIDEGCASPEALREDLETWRFRRQEKWLKTDYVTKKLRQSFDVVDLSPEMERVRQRRALKIATAAKLKAMILEEAERCSP